MVACIVTVQLGCEMQCSHHAVGIVFIPLLGRLVGKSQLRPRRTSYYTVISHHQDDGPTIALIGPKPVSKMTARMVYQRDELEADEREIDPSDVSKLGEYRSGRKPSYPIRHTWHYG